MTYADLVRRFPTEDAAKAHLFRLRWKGGKVACPRCHSAEKIYRRAPKKGEMVSYRWVCKSCAKNGYGFSLTTGTVFEETKIGLDKWFQILFLMLTSKKSMSALQVQRTVFGQKRDLDGKVVGRGSYESTWYACHRIRAAMKSRDFRKLLGIVEIDETFVGGKVKNRHGGLQGRGAKRFRGRARGPLAGKAPVIGAIARKGNVVCEMAASVDGATLRDFVRATVDQNVELVATDQHSGYSRLRAMGYPHEKVDHTKGEYVRGVVHTANLDSFWSLLKRGIMGSFHHVSKDYLPLYLNEFSYRHNARDVFNAETFDRVLESC